MMMKKHVNHHFQLIHAAILSAIAAILQSAGGFLPIVGLLISPFATLPILLMTINSIPYGMMSYFTTIILLMFMQPSELFIFPFTTGLLGLALGVGIKLKKRKIFIITLSGLVLFIGILLLIYVIKFPILGPSVSTGMGWRMGLMLISFCWLYAYIWVLFTQFLMKRFKFLIRKEG
ncbi:MAG: DUF2232 domain-containing protein [Bacillaceae bacterium]|nr:DUF2232 domain-containing protein [Bacillaceae bacterium]